MLASQFGFSAGMPHYYYYYYYYYYYLSRFSIFRTLESSSSPFPPLSGVPQGSTFGPLLFNTFIDDLGAKIHFSEFLLLADDLKAFHVIKSAEDCKLLQCDTDSVQKWRTENYMKINIFKTNMISFTRKTTSKER
jgi:hypothetical protein